MKIGLVADQSWWRSERGKLAEFRNRAIPARHFRARLLPRPSLVDWVWGPDCPAGAQTTLLGPGLRCWGPDCPATT